MNGKSFKNIISLLLCAAFLLSLLSGCSLLPGKDSDSLSENETENASSGGASSKSDEPTFDSDFTLNCTGDGIFNPYTLKYTFDSDVAGLIYDCFFVLDDSFEPSSDICEKYETKDGLSYTFTVKEGLAMHDGSILDAGDVAYSVNKARNSALYMKRLSNIESCIPTGDYTLEISLYEKNYKFPALLDIPITANGTGDDSNPIGSGPYMLSDTGDYLTAFDSFRNPEKIKFPRIELRSFKSGELNTSFISHELDFLHMSSTQMDGLNIRTVCERNYYNTATLHYVGFNMTNPLTSQSAFRRAVSLLADRDSMVNNIMMSGAVPAPLILSPALYYYDKESWEKDKTYNVQAAKKLIKNLELMDTDDDGLLEYVVDDIFTPFELVFIVNEEDPHKTQAAQMIVDELNKLKIKTKLEILSWDEYNYALSEGNYDMYYGESRLTADFDVSPFLEYNGYLNYSGTENESLLECSAKLLSASGEKATAKAAATLCAAFYKSSPVVPLLYEKNSVITHWGDVSDPRFSQSGAFANMFRAPDTEKAQELPESTAKEPVG